MRGRVFQHANEGTGVQWGIRGMSYGPRVVPVVSDDVFTCS